MMICLASAVTQTMAKVSKLIKADQQLCFAHGIQLAVLDVLYNQRATHPPDDIQSNCAMANKTSPDSDNNDDDNVDMENNETFSVIEYDDVIAELSAEYQQQVNKVRAVVKIFKRSPTKK